MRRAKRPLNQKAVAAANKAIEAETGGRRLHPTDPADGPLRKKWMDAYIAAGGQIESGATSERPVDAPTEPCPTTVNIQSRPCRLIPKGKTKTYEAIGAPSGGTFQWTASGKVAIVGPANARQVEVRGADTSASMNDSELKVTYTANGKQATDTAQLTVVEIKKIKATVNSTPGVPPGNGGQTNAADYQLESTLKAESFPPGDTLIMLRGSLHTIALEVEFAPPRCPLGWDVKRADDDAAALGANTPTITRVPGAPEFAILSTDEAGSFFVRAFADCSGVNTFDPDDDFVLLPYVLANATVVRDNSATHTAHIAPAIARGRFRLRTGRFNIGSPNTEAIHMNVIADVTTGGPDGRRLIDRVFAGWINNESQNENIRASYSGGHARFSVFTSLNPGTTFLPGGPAPVLVPPPLLDSGRRSAGTGGDTATLTSSRIRSRTNRPLGQRWIVEAIDSPGDGAPLVHPHPPFAARIQRFHFELHFQAFLSFWTNRTAASGATGDPADRVYAVLRSYNWDMLGEWTIDAANNITTVTPMSVTISGRSTHSPMGEAHGVGCEVRAPTGLALLANDART